ncbi:TRAP-type C4-dicarboxylate transport system, small permease component [Natronoarchaeum philippinense]|uniref:TRAP-type C4-dicarboxylate transport system, small permease component n=1 Tax=Natronoarchaeum philippinense TaxID=558529 RepID=A0A285P6J5_NATPI|nr:TRAP transporter small permease subunit [Natronoarchaeum philippinense]SNZ15501.1 TRAP-type C4-dicarboxylate transport system, small permease component [Natronoarchaeum philippinense]
MEIDQSLDLKRDHLLDRIILYSATALFTSTIVLTTLQVFIRLLNLPTFGFLHWTQPAARFVLVIATYLGAAVAIRNNEQIAIQFLLERLANWKPWLGYLVKVLGKLVTAGFLLVALEGTVITTIDDWATSIGGIGFVTSGHLYLGIGIGLALMLLYTAIDLVALVREILAWTGDETSGSQLEEGMADE